MGLAVFTLIKKWIIWMWPPTMMWRRWRRGHTSSAGKLVRISKILFMVSVRPIVTWWWSGLGFPCVRGWIHWWSRLTGRGRLGIVFSFLVFRSLRIH